MIKNRGQSFVIFDDIVPIFCQIFTSITFMFEIGNKKQLAFLDVLAIINCTSKSEFDVFKNKSHTDTYSRTNSHNSI